ncbi:hypothetical protein K458DRAFT_429702 [Lentithecium fluviatile CBS 122367]|uniref:Uncharacterized protein n=1 Tax=Lentithecium fluviatile CBS 122367 TaxID=1168545 RepID=A0A6G1J8K4_9PLEO|nr:hypothetical protein K458DRAFT_429702 [Lentithecium fluviatile CBS 122367]
MSSVLPCNIPREYVDATLRSDDAASSGEASESALQWAEDVPSDEDDDGRPKNIRPTKKIRASKVGLTKSSEALPAVDSPEHRHNVDSSRLHQLPAELILNIADYIAESTMSILCMQLVARDFYPLFEVPFIVLPSDRDAFKAALRRDDFAWFSKWEQAKGLDILPHAVCSACNARHPKEYFVPEELGNDLHQRTCIGAKETIRLYKGQEATLNDIYGLTPNACRLPGIAAVYVSKRMTQEASECISEPIIDTVVAHVTWQRRLEVAINYRIPNQRTKAPLQNESLLVPTFASASHVCSQLQMDLRRSGTTPFFNPRFSDLAISYSRYGYRWYSCGCDDPTCYDSVYSVYFRLDPGPAAQDGAEVVLTVLKIYRADEDYAGPDWHKQIFQELIRQQMEWNAKCDGEARIRLYQAKEEGNWSWLDLGSEKMEVSKGDRHSPSAICNGKNGTII